MVEVSIPSCDDTGAEKTKKNHRCLNVVAYLGRPVPTHNIIIIIVIVSKERLILIRVSLSCVLYSKSGTIQIKDEGVSSLEYSQSILDCRNQEIKRFFFRENSIVLYRK